MSTTTTTTTTTTTATKTATITLRRRSKSDVRSRRPRLSTARHSSLNICTLPASLDALDLSGVSPTQTLASLRYIVLSYLAILEQRLSDVESPDVEAWLAKGELTLDEAKLWASTALEMLHSIRDDVCSHLPDVTLSDLSSVESFVKSHLPDMPDVPGLVEMRSRLPDMTDMRSHLPDMPDVRSHLPDMPQMPDFDDVRAHLSDMYVKLDDVRARFHDLDFERPLNFLPTLSNHLSNLHSHLSSMELSSRLGLPSLPPTNMLTHLMDSLMSTDFSNSAPEVMEEVEGMISMAAHEVGNAVKRSLEGVRLIAYSDLPHPWRNNPFVTHGYRFIPIERWPLLVMSLFKFHNETLNIHTHLIPCIFWLMNLIPLIKTGPQEFDVPEILFMCFALLCLFSSSVWHTMSGCAHHKSMEFCARVDYVGIGWLISASIGTVVHYGFQCHPHIGHAYLGLCLATGLAGNIFPFMKWFNMHEYRFYRIGFFLALAFSAIGPMVSLGMLHSRKEMYDFVAPIVPSLLSYLTGLFFYAAHFPERALPESIRHKLDRIGGGSHAIWHCFIVLAVSQHKTAIQSMKLGLQCVSAH